MSPEVDQILLLSSSQLAGTLVPLLPEGYPQGQASLLSFMLVMCGQEYERGADVRAGENNDMRALFRALSPEVTDKGLGEQLAAAADTRDESLTISALNASNAELRRLLIALQDHLERKDNRAAQTRIWEQLKRSAARRLIKLA